MKRWMLLLAMMMMNYSGFSQHLKPIVRTINEEPYFCFNRIQAKELAKLITLASFNDSLLQKFTTENLRLRFLVQNKEHTIAYQKDQLDNYELIIGNHEVTKGLMEQKIKARDRKIKKSKAGKILLGLGLLVTTTLLIIK